MDGFGILDCILDYLFLPEHRWVTFDRMGPAQFCYFNCLSKRVYSGEINPVPVRPLPSDGLLVSSRFAPATSLWLRLMKRM
jgi:hypothetical protein